MCTPLVDIGAVIELVYRNTSDTSGTIAWYMYAPEVIATVVLGYEVELVTLVDYNVVSELLLESSVLGRDGVLFYEIDKLGE